MSLEDEIIEDNNNTAQMIIETLNDTVEDARDTWSIYIMTLSKADLRRFKKLQIKITNLCNQLLTHQHYYNKYKDSIIELRDEFNDKRWLQFEDESL